MGCCLGGGGGVIFNIEVSGSQICSFFLRMNELVKIGKKMTGDEVSRVRKKVTGDKVRQDGGEVEEGDPRKEPLEKMAAEMTGGGNLASLIP